MRWKCALTRIAQHAEVSHNALEFGAGHGDLALVVCTDASDGGHGDSG